MTPPTSRLLDPSASPDPLHTAIVALRQQLQDVVAESSAYRQEVEAYQRAQLAKDAVRDRQRKRENTVGVLIAVAICIPILIMLGLLGQNLSIARDAQKAADEAKKTSAVIADCITPTGKCYRDGNKRQSGAVQQLTRMQLAVAWCTKTTVTKPALDACVTDLLKPTPTTTP